MYHPVISLNETAVPNRSQTCVLLFTGKTLTVNITVTIGFFFTYINSFKHNLKTKGIARCLCTCQQSSHSTLSNNMVENFRSLNLIFLSIFNGLFFFVGIFLNSVVITGLLKSKQHLKSLCSFMILVLTSVDLCTVIVCHPLIIMSSCIWSNGDYDLNNIYHRVKTYSNILFHFSFMALLVMNVDRFLAVNYPFFHKRTVTRRRLLALLGILSLIVLIERVLAYRMFLRIVCFAVEAVLVFVLVVLISVINVKTYNIAQTHRKVATGVSTCILAVACFFLFSAPLLIYSAIQFFPETLHADNAMLFSLWASTLACINSSANCLIFFWKDRRLRLVGVKVLQSLVRRKESPSETQTR